MGDTLDSVVQNWSYSRPPSTISNPPSAPPPSPPRVPAGLQPQVPGTRDQPPQAQPPGTQDQLPPVPPPPSGQADPSDPTSMPSQAPPPPLPEPPIPPASPPAVPDGLQPKTVAPGAGTPLAPALSTVAAKQPTDTGLPTPVTDTPRWQEMSPTQLYNPQFPPVAVAIGQPESGMQNIRQRIKDPVTGQLQPAGQGTGPASGYFQIEDDTWRFYAPKMGVDLTKWPTAMAAPPQVQWAVAQSMPLNRWSRGTYAGFRQQYPWVNGNMTLGQINAQAGGTDEYGVPRQYLVAATEREAGARFQPDPNWNSGTPGMMPSSWDIPRIMSGPIPQLLALASSLFARVPLINAIAAYGAMAKAQQNGQLLDYQMNKDKWQTASKEHQAMQQMEGQDVDEALTEFADNPEDMKQAMMQIARRYNDPNLNMLAQQERFDQIEKLQKVRDKYNQPLQKMQLEQEKQQLEQEKVDIEKQKVAQETKDQQTFDTAVAGKDAEFAQDNPNATPAEKADAHIRNIGAVNRELKPSATESAEDAKIYDVTKDGQPTGTQVRAGRDGGLFEIGTNKPYTLQPGEKVLAKSEKEATPARPGTVDQMMEDWLAQQRQDPKRWSGGEVGKGDYTPPSVDETAKERGHLTQESAKPTVTSRQIGERLSIAAENVSRTLEALSEMPKGASLGIFGGAQAQLTPQLLDNMRKALANKMTPRADQMIGALSTGLGRSMAILEAAGASTGLVGLSAQMQKDLPQKEDDGFTVMTKLANIRQTLDSAVSVLLNDPTLGDANSPQKQRLAEIQSKVHQLVPWTTADVVKKAFNPTDANMRDLARQLGLLKDQSQGGTQGGLPPGVTVEVH